MFKRDVGLDKDVMVEAVYYPTLKKMKKAFKKAESKKEKKIIYVGANLGYFANLINLNRDQVATYLPYLAKQRSKLVKK